MLSHHSITFYTLKGLAVSPGGADQTPPMGYNTYNAAWCTINQTFIRDTMQAFHDRGFLSAGYDIFGLDCGWQGMERQANGSITYDSSVFPDGIKPLSELAIDLGFQWGMYTDQGVYACDTGPKRPGSLYYEEQDAKQFAGWNVAHLKVDNCYVEANGGAPKDASDDFISRFSRISTAIHSVGIEGLLICQWGVPQIMPSGKLIGPAQWTPGLSSSFRISDDVTTSWKSVLRIMNQAININLRGLTGPGHWADMDLLEVGNGMTEAEQQSHFAIWAMFKSPLMVSTDVIRMSAGTEGILLNKGLIAVNQDEMGMPAVLVQRFSNDYDLFAGPLMHGDIAVLLLDHTDTTRELGLDFSALDIASADVENLWTGESKQGATSYSTTVQGHGSVPLRLSKVSRKTPASPHLEYYEAEHGTFSGRTAAVSCSGCSRGQRIGYIGGGLNNTLTISNIRTSQAEQDVLFDYVNCELAFLSPDIGHGNVRGASISVNGGAAQKVLFPLSGYDWDVDVAKGFKVRLGGFKTTETNSIVIDGLWSVSPFAPDIDRIGVLV
ncbi:putative alpha-galactosidase [Teratosphaeria destructans]|uniref:Alpha-galactosidase n=1 Tax=Teratosphaeria destructans TaxID=418781 RepID=A0A9W7W2K6_9PEZI|nr:putative alpha-galactosidase [Teratosphaeria destructans]